MSMEPTTDKDEQDLTDERQANAMKDQLRKDVASWSAARSETSMRQAPDAGDPAVKQPAPSGAKRRQAKAPPVEAPRVATAKKPFSMSYDGVTTTEHINYLLSRGSR